MINLGLTRRWQSRPGAVERCKARLLARTSPTASRYVLHIPAWDTTRTLCGLDRGRVHCVATQADEETQSHCRRCRRARGLEVRS